MGVNINILEALKILDLPPFITKDEIKKRYYSLVKNNHPDVNKNNTKMAEINEAYKIIMEYIENYRYSFDEDELNKQMPDFTYNNKFRV